MLYVSGNNQADDIEAFNSTTRVDQLLIIDNPYVDQW